VSERGEPIVRTETREITILVAREDVTIIETLCAPGERIAGPHVHRAHTDSFYVLEGELVFEVGREAEPIVLGAGGFVSVPREVMHAFRTGGDRPSRWLTIHAPDGGFAAFMRGIRDGVEVEWDIAAVPEGGGLPAGETIVVR
jgi:quercetin dioxygenase-like cupin family protein